MFEYLLTVRYYPDKLVIARNRRNAMVPFTQYLFPNGEQRHLECDFLSPEVEKLAHKFIEKGGKFEMEMLTDYTTVSITAAFIVNNEWQDIACKLSTNGPGIETKTEKLIRSAYKWLEENNLI
jgi:hypothetical protein